MIDLISKKRVLILCFVVGLMLAAVPFAFPARAQDDPLPNGPGKQLVLTKCTVCHDVYRFADMRQSADDWANTVNTMGQNGLQLSDDEYNTVMTYLSTYMGTTPPKINVNKASADDLQKGLALTADEAAAIVKYRTDHGNFTDWHGVAAVDGVDPKKIEAKKDDMTF
jgi:competence ComEA-like helix-hairpin-helix protein